MSFISGALDKSVFNQKSYQAAFGDKSNGYAVVKIKPNRKRLLSENSDPSIKGVLNTDDGGFNFNIDADWRDLGSVGSSILPNIGGKVNGAYGLVNNIANFAGASNFGAAYSSKLIYQQSGRLEIKIPMMVVDWEGNGQPMLTAMLLSYYCLPKYYGNVGDAIKKIEEQIIDSIPEDFKNKFNSITGAISSFAKKTFNEGLEFLEEKAGATGKVAADTIKVLKEAGKQINNNLTEDIEDSYSLRSSPVPVIVQIGEFFKHKDMVIKGVSFNFSKEMTRSGPLYAKFDIQLASRMVMVDLADTGLTYNGLTFSRYSQASSSFVGAGSNATGF